jgi:hypothetical protein
MTHETNFHCPVCGAELYATENMHHTYYVCISPVCNDRVYAVRGTDHYMHVDEIDLKTGQHYEYDCDKKGYVLAVHHKELPVIQSISQVNHGDK